MFCSIFRGTVARLCKDRRRSFVTLTTDEFIARYGRIWDVDEYALLTPPAQSYVKGAIYQAGHMLHNGEEVEDVVNVFRQSIKGMLVAPATSSSMLKMYSSFMGRFDNFTELRDLHRRKIPYEFRRLFLRNALSHLYCHPLHFPLSYHNTYAVTCLSHYRSYDGIFIQVTGSTNILPGLILEDSPDMTVVTYYNNCSIHNDPRRYFHLEADLSGCKVADIRDRLGCMKNPPKDYRLVNPFDVLVVYRNHTIHYGESQIRRSHKFFDEELCGDVGVVPLDCWDYGVAKGSPDYLSIVPFLFL